MWLHYNVSFFQNIVYKLNYTSVAEYLHKRQYKGPDPKVLIIYCTLGIILDPVCSLKKNGKNKGRVEYDQSNVVTFIISRKKVE